MVQKKKRRNQTDATLRNVRAAVKRLGALEAVVNALGDRVAELEHPVFVSEPEPCPPVSTVQRIEDD